MTRIESPSSINTYLQCPRKYYYSYKVKLPRKDSIATITGKAVHDALEKFYILGAVGMDEKNYVQEFQDRLMRLFNENWSKAVPNLLGLKIEKDMIMKYYEDTMGMLNNFVSFVINKVNFQLKDGKGFEQAFEVIKPETEVHFTSDTYMLQGFVDALYVNDDFVHVVDYKTSKRDHMSDDYRRQLAIYALMYKDQFGKLPNKVGLYFLRQGTERDLDASEELVNEALEAVTKVHANSKSDSKEDYPVCPGPLCKWRTGACDFYDYCFNGKELPPKKEEEI